MPARTSVNPAGCIIGCGPNAALAGVRFSGSHDLGLSAALGLAEHLRMLPADVSIWCAEGLTVRQSFGRLPCAATAAAEVVEHIQKELAGKLGTVHSCLA